MNLKKKRLINFRFEIIILTKNQNSKIIRFKTTIIISSKQKMDLKYQQSDWPDYRHQN